MKHFCRSVHIAHSACISTVALTPRGLKGITYRLICFAYCHLRSVTERMQSRWDTFFNLRRSEKRYLTFAGARKLVLIDIASLPSRSASRGRVRVRARAARTARQIFTSGSRRFSLTLCRTDHPAANSGLYTAKFYL